MKIDKRKDESSGMDEKEKTPRKGESAPVRTRDAPVDIGPTLKDKLMEWAKGDKGRRILVVIGLAGIALIALSAFWPKGEDKAASSTGTVRLTADEYAAAVEEKLAGIIGSIEGAGRCQVMVTLENGVEYIYASQQKQNTDRKESGDQVSEREDNEQNVIIVDTADGRQGLVVTEIQPTVKGVVVVCEGGDQALVQERVTGAITTALNITSRRVCVTKLSG